MPSPPSTSNPLVAGGPTVQGRRSLDDDEQGRPTYGNPSADMVVRKRETSPCGTSPESPRVVDHVDHHLLGRGSKRIERPPEIAVVVDVTR